MKRAPGVLLVLGVIIALAGVIFTLQGLGVLGPAASLMYENPAWVTQGSVTFILGVLLVLAATALARRHGP